MASRARDLEKSLAEPWPAHRCASSLDDALVCELKSRFAIMTPLARRGALYASVLAPKRAGANARVLALREVAIEDSDEWARHTAMAIDGKGERFDVDRLRIEVKAVDVVVRSIREAIANANASGSVVKMTSKAEMYLAPKSGSSETHGHFTLRERRAPKKRPISSGRPTPMANVSTINRAAKQEASMFAPTRKPMSGGASFLRDTSRAGSFGARARAGADRPGAKTMVIDVAEAAALGVSASADPLRMQAQEERERKRQREKEAKEERIKRLMEEREARKQEELSRKRQRDEEILEKKKAYRAEIEAKRAKQRIDEAQKDTIHTPSPTDDAPSRNWS